MIPEPTTEQCSRNERTELSDGRVGYAGWYPQMGGYVGKCIVVPVPATGGMCFDVYVWHNGEFPFRGEGDPAVQPIELHHCMASQFIDFGEWLETLERDAREDEEERSG